MGYAHGAYREQEKRRVFITRGMVLIKSEFLRMSADLRRKFNVIFLSTQRGKRTAGTRISLKLWLREHPSMVGINPADLGGVLPHDEWRTVLRIHTDS